MTDRESDREVIQRLLHLAAIGPDDAERFLSVLGLSTSSARPAASGPVHLFDLSDSCLEVSAVGNHAVWAAALTYVSQRDGFDPYIIPPPARLPTVREIWTEVFPPSRILTRRPDRVDRVRSPREAQKIVGMTASNAFEDALWQVGFSLAPGEKIDIPVLWRCNPDSDAVMIAPVEYSEGNRYYDAQYWLDRVREIHEAGFQVNLFGVQLSDRDQDGHGFELIGRLVTSGWVSRNYGSTIAELQRCIGESSQAICSSTGPTWLCLYSDIPQVMLCAPTVRSPQWRCDVNAKVIAKPVTLVHGKNSIRPLLKTKRTSKTARNGRTARFRFHHGLGDVSNAAWMLQLHRARGIDVQVSCTEDKAFVFRAAGAALVDQAPDVHPWPQPITPFVLNFGADVGEDWAGNKIGGNLNHPLLGEIGRPDELWRELCGTELNIAEHVRPEVRDRVRSQLDGLFRPLILLHTTGTTCQAEKSIPREDQLTLYRELLNRTSGTLVLLDWDQRIETLASYRARHLLDLLGPVDLEELTALISLSDLVIGVDSGPLHLAGLTNTPCVGVFRGPHHHPASYCIPSKRRLCVTEGALRETNIHKRIQFGIVEAGRDDIDVTELAALCERMLSPARYLPAGPIAADVQLQQFVSWCNGGDSGMLSRYADRQTSFDILFRETVARFQRPHWVETGCIRAAEDWAGAGYSTFLFGAFLSRLSGRLDSIDVTPEHCRFAAARTAVFGDTVQVHQARGNEWLAANRERIDVLYLDSLDTTVPGHEASCLEEVQAALGQLHQDSLILFDDTPFVSGQFAGKGAVAVPWLLARGWRIRYAGYQVLLERER